MATIPQIRDRLLKEFSEPQADLLAHVVTEAYDSLATKADQLLDTVEGQLAEEEVDDLLRADLVATAVVDGTPMHLVGEVSCTADDEDVVRAARRAGHLRKAGLLAMPFVACEAIGPKTLELASREQVRVLVEGRLLPESAS
jgi:hypothetical protein